MIAVADEDDVKALAGVADDFVVNLGDEGAGGVVDDEVAGGGGVADARGDAVGAEDDGLALGDLADILDEGDPAGAEVLDDVAVMNDLVIDVEGRALCAQDLIDDVDGHAHAGAEASGIGEDDLHSSA